HDGQKKYDFWKDMVAAIQHNYKISAFKVLLVIVILITNIAILIVIQIIE
ncbi:PREDICTED: 5'-nucleotidase domain-containing protein 1-like, partial [Eurypyga helias]